MKLKYVVCIQYYYFEFDTPEEAIEFATSAKAHATGRRANGENIEVTIELVNEEDENKEETEE